MGSTHFYVFSDAEATMLESETQTRPRRSLLRKVVTMFTTSRRGFETMAIR